MFISTVVHKRKDGGVRVPADMHCHTKLSDGSVGIDELIYLATKLKINTLAVTDHDTFAGAKRAKIIGKRYGIEVILGAEVSSFSTVLGKEIHVLCYLCDNPDRLEGLFKKINAARQKAIAEVLRTLMRFYPISPEIVSQKAQGSTNVFKNHVVRAVMDTGYPLPYGVLYDRLFNKQMRLTHIDYDYPETDEVIRQIHDAGGVAVLAHPGLSGILDNIKDIVSLGIDGIEVWHPSANEEAVNSLLDIASKYDLVPTGGSDFHGMYAASICTLGCHVTPDESINSLEHRKEKVCKGS